MDGLTGQNALVTGASRGIGRVLTRALADEGVNVVLAARSAEALAEEAKALEALGVRALAVPTDVSRPEELDRLVSEAVQAFGRIDILVNNAGSCEYIPYHRVPHDHIESDVRINLVAPMLLARMVLPEMLKAGRGHIVNIASLSGRMSLPYAEAYCATKAGLVAFSDSLRMECDGTGVHVSAILPGIVEGDGMFERLIEGKGVTMPREVGGCTPDDVAAAVMRALKKGGCEILVNKPSPRLAIVLFQLFPRLKAWFGKSRGYDKVIARIAGADDTTM